MVKKISKGSYCDCLELETRIKSKTVHRENFYFLSAVHHLTVKPARHFSINLRFTLTLITDHNVGHRGL